MYPFLLSFLQCLRFFHLLYFIGETCCLARNPTLATPLSLSRPCQVGVSPMKMLIELAYRVFKTWSLGLLCDFSPASPEITWGCFAQTKPDLINSAWFALLHWLRDPQPGDSKYLLLASVVFIQISKFFFSRIPSFCIFFIASISIFSFVSFMFAFSWLSLKEFIHFLLLVDCVSLAFFDRLIHFLHLFVFSRISLRNLFISSLRTSVIFIQLVLRSFSCASAIPEYSVSAAVS